MTHLEWKRLESSSRRTRPDGRPANRMPAAIHRDAGGSTTILMVLAVAGLIAATVSLILGTLDTTTQQG